MVENLINLNKLKKHLNISFNDESKELFSNLNYGFFELPAISFIFDNKNYNVSIYEIFDIDTIIIKNKEYNNQSLTDELPNVPENSFIFASDIGGDFFAFNSISNVLYYSGEVTFYNFIELSISIYDLVDNLILIDEPIDFVFNFNKEEIKLLNYVDNEILYEFLKVINYGINDINFKYSKNNEIFYDNIDFIYGFDYLINTNKKIENLFLFGKTITGKEIVLNIKNGNVLFKDGTFIEHYKNIFKKWNSQKHTEKKFI